MNPDTGLPNLITEDESCTYPAKAGLQAGIDFENPYTATTDYDLTEGYVEIIEMGDIADGPGPAQDGGLEAEIDAGGVADGVIDSGAGDRSITMYGLLHDAAGLPPLRDTHELHSIARHGIHSGRYSDSKGWLPG